MASGICCGRTDMLGDVEIQDPFRFDISNIEAKSQEIHKKYTFESSIVRIATEGSRPNGARYGRTLRLHRELCSHKRNGGSGRDNHTPSGREGHRNPCREPRNAVCGQLPTARHSRDTVTRRKALRIVCRCFAKAGISNSLIISKNSLNPQLSANSRSLELGPRWEAQLSTGPFSIGAGS